MELTKPWEQQAHETEKAYAAFRFYRDMPAKDRSVANAVKGYYGVESVSKVNVWRRWSVRFSWLERVRSWEAEQDRVGREARLKAIADMNERHIRAANAMFSKAFKRFADLESSHMGPRVTLDFLVEAIRLERLVRGEPETIVQQNSVNANLDLDLSRLTNEQLRILEDIAKLTGGTATPDTSGESTPEPD